MSWQLIKITATSSHPVRNSRGELMPPWEHTLWDQSNPSKYKDDGGSLQPNVYGYTFGSPVGDIGYVNVTVIPLKRLADDPTFFLSEPSMERRCSKALNSNSQPRRWFELL
jgi:hypothetical protein